jgi:glycine/D-amino acid oxidase-like deaminating enzyme
MTAAADLLVLGGGVMGLFAAHHAARLGKRVTVVERGRIGDPSTASYGLTRSYRSDYLDPAYARLAEEARRLWEAFERESGARLLVRCGCLNIAKRSVTPDLGDTYAQRSHEVMAGLGLATDVLDRGGLAERYPYLDADIGRLAVDGGVVDLPAVRRALLAGLEAHGAEIAEEVETTALAREAEGFRATTSAGERTARTLVIAAGHGTNDLLGLLPGCRLRVPIARDRPSEAKYVTPPAGTRERFTAASMPVVAYLDTGIYCHPIVDGLVDAVKIGYYNPPDMPRRDTEIDSVAAFVERCMPGLRGAEVRDVEDVDGCDYDLVADDDFVLGPVPGVPGAAVGVGWRGTGYKFAPWVGRVLAELAVQGGTIYDIARFAPARFDAEAPA